MLQFLGMPKLPKQHWNDGASWMLAECMFRQVEAKALETVQAARFISFSCDKITSIDNGLWICIHCYVVQNWSKVSILISKVVILGIQRLTGGRNEQASERAYPLYMARTGRTRHIL
jgi:hypothetical protein